MTDYELHQLALRENVTLRRYERNDRLYWYACGRHQGTLHSVYLCADTRLEAFQEADFLSKVRRLPGRSGDDHLGIRDLPGQSLRVSKGKKVVVLTYDDVQALAQWVEQKANTSSV
jgi:hypothetical protein